jgi:transposase
VALFRFHVQVALRLVIWSNMESFILDLHNQGLSQRAIGKKLGLSQTSIGRVLRAHGQSRSNRTDGDIEKSILDAYLSGESSEELAKRFGLSATTICRIIKRLGGNIRPPEINKRKYEIREDFFELIDSEEKAYVLGFLYADGNVSKTTNTIKLTVHKQDVDILQKILKCIFIDNSPAISADGSSYKYITITNKKIKEDLIKLGCVPNKTFEIRMPEIRSDLLRHFLRGIYDGDGCINISKDNRLKIVLTGNKEFTYDVAQLLENQSIKSSLYEPKNNIGSLVVSAKISSVKLLNLLYSDSTIYLNRKYKKYLDAVNFMSDKITTPKQYAKNIFSYNGIKVTGRWLATIPIEERKEVAKTAFEYFRAYGFPYPYYSKEERLEDWETLQNIKPIISNNQILTLGEQGLKSMRHHCPHYFEVKSSKLPSMISAFNNDDKLMNTINNRMGITYKETFNITGNMIRQGLRNSRQAFAASLFKPVVAKAIYERYCSENNVVLDISIGFGQRLLGAAASSKVKHYVGLDPWKKTIEAVENIRNEIGFSAELICAGSERCDLDKGAFDFCFSSPPFYNKEIYSEDSAQAYADKTLEEFLTNWWEPTVTNVHAALRPGSLFVLNMDPKIFENMSRFISGKFELKEEVFIQFHRKHMSSGSRDMFYVLKRLD